MPRGGYAGQRRTANRQAPRFSALGTHRPIRSVVSAGPASGCSGGAAARLDAVLGEQVAQAAEFATQPLLTGKHLLFPVAQRRGGLEVSAANAASFCRRTRASWSAASARSAGTVSWTARACGSVGLPRPVSSSITRSQTRAWLAPAPISTWAAMPWPSRSRPSRRCSEPISPCPRPGRKAHYHGPGDWMLAVCVMGRRGHPYRDDLGGLLIRPSMSCACRESRPQL